MTRNLDTTRSLPIQFALLTIGLCKDLAGEERLRAAGVERIWRIGNGSESLADAVYDFRGRTGALAVTDDLRIFGESNAEISAVCAQLLRLGISIVDIDHPEQVPPELQERARKALHASRPIPNHRIARRRGRMGGLAKAAAAEVARAMRIAPEIARKLCASRLTWKEKAEILDMPVSTVQRHYGAQHF